MENRTSVGVDVMDQEHDLEFALLEALSQLVNQKDWAQADHVMKQADEYTQMHFLSEELLMRLHAYPQFDAHVAAHSLLTRKLGTIRSLLELRKDSSAIQLIRDLQMTFQGHIDGMDVSLGTYLKANSPTQNFRAQL